MLLSRSSYPARAARWLAALLPLLPILMAPATASSGGAVSAGDLLAPVPGVITQEEMLDADLLSALQWRNIGPAVMGGRVSDLAVVEADPAIFYVGTATGGLWKTTSNGAAWEPVFDDQATSSIGAVTISQTNPNLVWVGTGEPQNRQSSPWGNGVYRSLDAGRTWEHKGLYETRHIGSVVIDPSDNDVIYVAAVGQLWGPNPERGVFRSKDGGDTWEHVLFIDEDTGAIDLVMDPSDPNTLFAAMYQRRRTSFGFNGGGPGSGIYRTLDGGDTWTELTAGLPEGNKGRIGLDIYRGNTNVVYALVEAFGAERGVYRSMNRGDTWEQISETNPRPMYFSLMRVDPNDMERIYLGGVALMISDDGGSTFHQMNWPGVHVDHHALWIDPNNSNHVILGNDGGVDVSYDKGENWRAFENLPIGQFYEIGVDMRDPYYVCGGLQDNSTWCGPSATYSSRGIMNQHWFTVSGGDGFYARIDPNDPNIVFAESQGGNVSRIDLRTFERTGIRPAFRTRPGHEVSEEDEGGRHRWNWNTPIEMSSHDPATIYLGSNILFKSTDRGQTWEAISPDLTRQIDRREIEIMGQLPTGQMLSRNDGISTYGNLTTISESPLDSSLLYAGTDDGNLQVTRDGGATWQLISQDMPGLPENTYVSRVEASRFDEGTVYATFDGHDRNDYRPYVYVSDNYGEDWKAIVDGLPDDWSVNIIYEHPRTPNLLFLGNEVGVYFSIDRGVRWRSLKLNMPTVPVDDLLVHPRDNDLVVGTHGRSIWILEEIGVLEHLAGAMDEDVYLFPARRATVFNRSGQEGYAAGDYAAPNPPYGARIRYFLAPSEGTAQPEVTLSILDASGQMVRELTASGEAGVSEVMWDLRLAPPYGPGEAQEVFGGGGRGGGGFFGGGARGPSVMPGIYTVQLEANGETLTTGLEVRADPRIEISESDRAARHRAIMDSFALARPAFEAFRAARGISEQLSAIRDVLDSSDTAPDELSNEARQINAALRDLRQEMNIMRAGSSTFGAIERSHSLPTEDQLWTIDRAWEKTPGIIDGINELISERLPALASQVYAPGIGPEPGEPVTIPTRPGR
jgi:photosystem II stability/assembly factor-like uncharacterized protein